MSTDRIRGNRFSEEQAFVSALPTSPASDSPTVLVSSSAVKRQRRIGNASDDNPVFSDYPGFIVEDFRVAGPKVADIPHRERSFPAAVEHSHVRALVDDSTFRSTIYQILKSNGLRDATMEIIFAESSETNGFIPVLAIRTASSTRVQQGWSDAAEKVYDFCHNNEFDISVDISSRRYAQVPRLSCLVDRNQPIAQNWELVEHTVYQILFQDRHALGFRLTARGRPTDLPEDAFQPTILIYVSSHDPNKWQRVRDEVVNATERYGNCAVEVIRRSPLEFTTTTTTPLKHHEDIEPYRWNLQPIDAFLGSEAYVGASIGARETPTHSETNGTFCCIINLRRNGIWTSFGLTSWRVACPWPKGLNDGEEFDETKFQESFAKLPANEQEFHRRGGSFDNSGSGGRIIQIPSKTDIEGLKHDTKKRELQQLAFIQKDRDTYGEDYYQHASQGRLQEAYQIGPKGVAKGIVQRVQNIRKYQTRLSLIEERQRNLDVGSVAFGSGYRVAQFRPLEGKNESHYLADWALFDIRHDRLPEYNRVPPLDERTEDYNQWMSLRGSQFAHPPSAGATQTEHGIQVHKFGRTSGLTSGHFTHFDMTLLPAYHEGRYMKNEEYNNPRDIVRVGIIERSRVIQDRDSYRGYIDVGDSGALLYNRKDHMIGMVIGGDQGDYMCTFLPTAVLFDDIIKTTRADEVTVTDPYW